MSQYVCPDLFPRHTKTRDSPFEVLHRTLVSHKQVSPRTIVAYRDSFRLLLKFLKKRTGKQPFTLCVDDLNAPAIVDFLDSLEEQRGNQVCSRNARLTTAIRSFFQVVAFRDPEKHWCCRSRACYSEKTNRQTVGRISDTRRDGSCTDCARSVDVDRTSRLCATAHHV